MLSKYLECYRQDLDACIAFWLQHSLDREYGGYFTALDRDGTVYDTKKYMWLQGREVWMFSRLYNEWERKQEYLDAATLGLHFMRRYGRDEQGRIYFSLTRDGKPFFYQRKPYAAVFYMLGLLEYFKATGDESCLQESVDLFWRIREWINNPSLMGRPVMAGQPPMSGLADVMVLASMAIELTQVQDDPRYRDVMREAIAGVRRHYDPERRILVENVPLTPMDIHEWPETRMFIPGHSIEVAWFLLHILENLPDIPADEQAAAQQLALVVIEGSLEYGWDKEFGGLYYYMDLGGFPSLKLEADMKLWWPHTETLYALVLAYSLTRQDRWLSWLERVHQYSYAHFADPEYGEWFGYCDRRGNLTHTCKGGNYKGCFHVPRFLLMTIQRLQQLQNG
ncbi:MAG: N-acylglucosamine 2-epimerase [Chloroflexi bacterium]|nr:N-acylglucosamine 2-epimerase [Chloroflexota bacterium]